MCRPGNGVPPGGKYSFLLTAFPLNANTTDQNLHPLTGSKWCLTIRPLPAGKLTTDDRCLWRINAVGQLCWNPTYLIHVMSSALVIPGH